MSLLRRVGDRNIWLIYTAIGVLGLAYGLAIAVIALFLDAEGYAKTEIGSLAAWFAGGIVACSLPMGGFIRHFSARRTLVASLAGYAVAVALMPVMVTSYVTLALIRVVDGAASVGIWVSCETILLQRARKANKALVMALYSICMALGYVVGPVAARVIASTAPLSLAFYVSGALALSAALLVWWRLDPDDGAHEPDALDDDDDGDELGSLPVTPAATARELVWRIKNSCLATFCYGYFQASVVLFLPLFLAEVRDFPESQLVVIPAWFAGGMFLFTPVAGRLADRFGHLSVMRILAAVGVPVVALTALAPSYWMVCALVFVGGAVLASLSPVSLALQGVVVARADYARANSIYNAFYAAGMLLGPPVTSLIFHHQGGGPMLYHLAGLWACFVVFTIVFYRDDPRARLRTEQQQAADATVG